MVVCLLVRNHFELARPGYNIIERCTVGDHDHLGEAVPKEVYRGEGGIEIALSFAAAHIDQLVRKGRPVVIFQAEEAMQLRAANGEAGDHIEIVAQSYRAKALAE